MKEVTALIKNLAGRFYLTDDKMAATENDPNKLGMICSLHNLYSCIYVENSCFKYSCNGNNARSDV